MANKFFPVPHSNGEGHCVGHSLATGGAAQACISCLMQYWFVRYVVSFIYTLMLKEIKTIAF